MPYREVRVRDCQEFLRRWLARDGVRPIARATGLDRKTVRRFVEIASQLGLRPGDPWPDEKIVVAFVSSAKRPRSPTPPGGTEKVLLEHRIQIRTWLEQDHLLLTKVNELLAREGVLVPYQSLSRFAHKW
jgi:hypothetical protein